MMNNFYTNQAVGGAAVQEWMFAFFPLILLLGLWSIFWKGLALWHSGRRGHVGWFIAVLVINLAGILEIIYLFGIAKLKFSQLFSKKHL